MKFTLHKAMKPITIAVSIIFILLLPSSAQVSVAPANIPCFQFFDSNGNPLAGGRVFSYLAGTSTLENTYIDAGGIQQNTDPIILNSGGFACIWLANKSYKFVVQNSAGSIQRTMDNVTGYLGLLNLSNTWTFAQTFSQPITITPSDNQIILGSPGSQTILDAPPSSGTSTLHFQTSAANETIVNRNSTDTLTNKTLTAPVIDLATENTPTITTPIINGVKISNSPGSYIVLPNDTGTGTTVNRLAKLNASNPSGAVITASDTSGVIGVVTSGAGITGNSTIQQSGYGFCQFDAATTANDYVQVGSSGQCHDAGSAKPTSGQIIGKVLASNTSGGLLPVILYPPEIIGPQFPKVVGSNHIQVVDPASGFIPSGISVGSSDATFRVSGFVRQVQTGSGCAGATTSVWTVGYTDVSGGLIHPVLLTIKADGSAGTTASIQIAATNGAAGNFVVSIPATTFRAKAGTTFGITGTYVVGASCTTDPGMEVNLIYEQLTAN